MWDNLDLIDAIFAKGVEIQDKKRQNINENQEDKMSVCLKYYDKNESVKFNFNVKDESVHEKISTFIKHIIMHKYSEHYLIGYYSLGVNIYHQKVSPQNPQYTIIEIKDETYTDKTNEVIQAQVKVNQEEFLNKLLISSNPKIMSTEFAKVLIEKIKSLLHKYELEKEKEKENIPTITFNL